MTGGMAADATATAGDDAATATTAALSSSASSLFDFSDTAFLLTATIGQQAP